VRTGLEVAKAIALGIGLADIANLRRCNRLTLA
jgi:isopentenyl diphosphate isomerase/L-lactate dehydrogenase-like FMN-dependent dehydrogenase